jgi:hypothetical protein
MEPPRAKAERYTAETGIRVDEEGCCLGCRHPVVIGVPHTPSCGYARKAAEQAAVTVPVTPELSTPVRPIVTPALTIAPAPKETPMPTTVCSYCKKSDGEHTEGCKRKEGCKLCRRFAPAKCQRHGGPRRKPATGGGKHRAKPKRVLKTRGRTLKTAAEPAVSANGHAPARATVTGARDLLKNKLEEQLVDARAEVRALERMLGTLA